MGAIRLIVGSELRHRWRGILFVALLVAFGGAVTLAAVAGARRTSTSFDRFRESSLNHDVLVFASDVAPADVARMRALRGVEGVGYARQLALVRPNGDFIAVGGPLDGGLLRDVDRLRIVEGRPPDPAAPEEVVLPESLARLTHLGIGDVVPFETFSQAQIAATGPGDPTPTPGGPHLRLRVVAISRAPIDLGLQGAEGGVMLLQRSFVERYRDKIGDFSGPRGGVLLVRLTDGAEGVDRFLGRLRGILGDRGFDVDPSALSIGGVQESIDVLAIGVLVFGVIAGTAALVALALVISRQAGLAAVRQRALRDLGLSRRLRAAAIALPLLVAIVSGAVVALLGAWAASPLMPFGVAGRAEPDPGLHFDPGALGFGAVAVALVLGAVAALSSWRAARREPSEAATGRRRSALSRSLEVARLPPAAAVGIGMALEPRAGRDAVPVRSSLVGVAVAVLGISAVAVFSSSLGHLVDTEHDYGRNWDVQILDAPGADSGRPCGRTETPLVTQPGVEAVARVCSVSITLDGRAVGGIGVTSIRGSIEPTVLSGRAARGTHEVALGTATLRTLHKGIGDEVTAETPVGRETFRIVGRVVVPSTADAQALADGAVFTGAGLAGLNSPDTVSSSSSFAVRLAPGVDPVAARQHIDRLKGVKVIRTALPLEVERLQQVDSLPIVLSLFLAILGALALAHLFVTSVQRRRHELAILKALGFHRIQFSATLAAQATTVACTGVVIGLAAGAAAGAALWRVTARNVGVLPKVDLPVLLFVAIAVATVGLANAVAAYPALVAARTRTATILRSE